MAATSLSFASDIYPLLFKWKSQMIWRLDLTSYTDVKMNADIIYAMISTNSMPPPPYPPLNSDQINLFKKWMNEGCPE